MYLVLLSFAIVFLLLLSLLDEFDNEIDCNNLELQEKEDKYIKIAQNLLPSYLYNVNYDQQ